MKASLAKSVEVDEISVITEGNATVDSLMYCQNPRKATANDHGVKTGDSHVFNSVLFVVLLTSWRKAGAQTEQRNEVSAAKHKNQ